MRVSGTSQLPTVSAPRPDVPPLLSFSLALWLGAALAYNGAQAATARSCFVVAIVSAVLCLVALLIHWKAVRALPMLLVAGLLGGAGWALSCGGLLHGDEARTPTGGTIELRAIEDARDFGFGPVFAAEVLTGDGAGLHVRACLPEGAQTPLYGNRVVGDASWSNVGESGKDRAWSAGLSHDIKLSSCEIKQEQGVFSAISTVRTRAISMLNVQAEPGTESGSALLQALLCGYRGNLSDSALYDAFKTTGLAHLVAVSGAHLSIASMAFGIVLRKLRTGRGVLIGAQVLFLASFLVLTGCSPSSVRAAIMAGVSLLSFFAGKRHASLAAVGLAVVAFILLDAKNAVSVSFTLSALSTAGIVMFAPLFSGWVDRVQFAPIRVACGPVVITLASSVLTGAYSAALFSQTSLVGPLANVLTAPFFPVLCVGGYVSCAAGLTFPFTAHACVGAACVAATWFNNLVQACAAIPHAAIPIYANPAVCLAVSGAFAAALWMAWPTRVSVRTASALLAGAVVLCVVPWAVSARCSDEVVMLDVGQGDAFLVRSEGSAVLIDTGTNDAMLREALARHRVLSLDAVIISHGDDDHMGSLEDVANVVEIDNILVANDAFSCACDSCERLLHAASLAARDGSVLGLSPGDEIEVGNFSLSVIWPDSFSDEGGNADSLCLLMTHNVSSTDTTRSATMLFTGDAEAEQLEYMIDEERIGNVDVLKVGHHGSRASLTDEVARELSPNIALISVGESNRYGHPADECLAILDGVGAQVFRTDEQEDVSCTFENDGTVRVQVG